MNHQERAIGPYLAMALVTLFSACGGGESPTGANPQPGTGGVSAPASLQALSGSGQSAVVTMELTSPIIVKVTAQDGTAVSGALVTWQISSGGGAISAGTTATDVEGRAQVKWTLGPKAGEQKVVAKLGSLPPVEFTATAKPDRPSTLVLSRDSVILGVDPGRDTASVAATIADRFDNPIPGVPVQWSAADTSIATVDGSGRITARRAGEVQIFARADTFRVAIHTTVKLQLNPMCSVPKTFPSQPGAAAGVPVFDVIPSATRAPHPAVEAIPYDVENDGDEDILLLSWTWPDPRNREMYTGEAVFWKNDGRGNFTAATAGVLGGVKVVADYPLDWELVDVDGDGRRDIFVAQTGFDAGCRSSPCPGAPNLLFVSRSDGTLAEEASTRLNPYDRNSFTHSSAAADVDCDGDIDLYEGNWFSGDAPVAPRLQINRGGGIFSAEDHRLPAAVTQPRIVFASAEFCDIDRDGDQDMVAGGGKFRDRLMKNDGFGHFYLAPENTFPDAYFGNAFNEALLVRCADLDLDGWPDVLLGSVNNNEADELGTRRPHLSYLRNKRDGTFSDVTSTHLPQSWTTGTVKRTFIVDANGDGWPDIVASGWAPGLARIFVNRGDGLFDEHAFSSLIHEYIGSSAIYPLDADGDGKTDYLIPSGTFEHFVLRQR